LTVSIIGNYLIIGNITGNITGIISKYTLAIYDGIHSEWRP